MDTSEFKRRYSELRPHYKEFAYRLHGLVDDLIKHVGIPVVNIEHRTKTPESFIEKIKRKSYNDPFDQIKDFAGLRIITYYQESVDRVKEIIYKEFEIDEAHSIDKNSDLGPGEFGYKSVHLIISLSQERAKLDEWTSFAKLSAEIQIRSVLEHAWADISHKLDYKAPSQLPLALRRRLFRLSALLEIADEEFKSLLNQAETMTKEITQSKEGLLPLNQDSLREFLEQNADLKKWEQLGIEAGMESLPHAKKSLQLHGLDNLLLLLRTVKIESIAEFENLFSDFEKKAVYVGNFVQLVQSKGQRVYASPVDMLILLVSFSRARFLPSDSDWGGQYDQFFIEALQETIRSISYDKTTASNS